MAPLSWDSSQTAASPDYLCTSLVAEAALALLSLEYRITGAASGAQAFVRTRILPSPGGLATCSLTLARQTHLQTVEWTGLESRTDSWEVEAG